MNGTAKSKQQTLILKILSSPKTAIAGIITGLLIGVYFKGLIGYLAPFGDSYVGLLALCTFPITAASIILGLASTLKSRTTNRKLLYLVIAFVCGMIITFSVSAISGFFGSKDLIGQQGVKHMATRIVSIETYAQSKASTTSQKAHKQQQAQEKLSFILKQITPRNIFAALNEGMTLKVILITLLIGIALGKSKSSEAETLLNFITSANRAFKIIFRWILYLLPFGLACIFAHNASSFSAANFTSLIDVTILIVIAGFVLIIIYNFIMARVLKVSFFKTFYELRKPILLAFLTMSTNVAIPSSIEALKKFRLSPSMVDLTIPLGLSINRQGNVMVLVIISMVSLGFYHINPTIGILLILFLSAGFMGESTFGGGVILIPTFITISKLIGMPPTAGIALLTITDLFVFWINILLTLQVNYALTAVIGKAPAVTNQTTT